MSIFQTTTVWQGASGLPGYTNLFFLNPGTDVVAQLTAIDAALSDFWDGVATVLPSGVTVTTSAEVQQLSEDNGQLETMWAINPSPSAHGGLGTGIGPSPAGACIAWNTGEVHAGRVVRGRTFIVPLALSVYQNDGTLTSGCVTALNDAAVGLIGASGCDFAIWSRPAMLPDGGGIGQVGDAFKAVTGVCKDKVAVLRSRRD